MKQGAFDYIVKPVEKSRLVSSVKRGIELRELHRENQLLKARVLSDQPEPARGLRRTSSPSARRCGPSSSTSRPWRPARGRC
ncbi:MAG: hypothetical protein MZU95_10895 [Desulfomicrobium escambiense]|nr:hypothetical protein [Desulfomicrobium escambiense]